VANSGHGFNQAIRFAHQCGADRFAIEGGGSYGRAFGRFLNAGGFRVCEVPTWRLDQIRRRSQGHKDDTRDAELAGRVDLTGDLADIERGVVAEAIRVLRNQREALVRQQTAAINRIRALLIEVDPPRAAGLGRVRSHKALQTLARVRYSGNIYRTSVAAAIRYEAHTALKRRGIINQLEETLQQLLPPIADQLTAICGISTIGAATIIGEVDDPNRFATAARFVSWCGAGPLDASSGRHQRHRLNRRGNRQVNRVLHTAILTQLRTGGPANEYVTRRTNQGKTKNEAIRAATRHLAAKTWRILHNNQLT
jgi:transposase